VRNAFPHLFAAAALVAGMSGTQAPSLDYTQWRGQDRAGGASALVRPRTWPASLKQSWRVDVGEGYSTPIISGETVYVFTRRDGNEVLTARRAATGAEIWHTSYAAPYAVADAALRHGAGPKATPLLYRGRVFTKGISGIVKAFDATTGTRVWQRPPPTEAAMVKAGDLFFALKDDAELIIARADRAAFDVVKRYTVATSATWAQPAISGKRILIKDTTALTMWTLE
jgi:hypothetical protein